MYYYADAGSKVCPPPTPNCQPPTTLQEMLDMLRDHKNNRHAARLEWIIIWLLVVDVLLMLFQLLGLFGLV